MDMSKDIVGAINLLLAELVPVLNEELPAFIVGEGLDPLKNVVSGTDNLGKINLGICTAEAKASYSITNMKGLSSIQIETLTLDSCEINGDESTEALTQVVGTLWVSAKLTSNLSADVGGSIKASCGGISEKVGISGTVTAKGVTGSGAATCTATVAADQACCTTLTITQLSLNYKDIDVSIDGLGIFNDLLDPLVDLINDVFGSYIKDELSSITKSALNSLLKDTLPLCVSY